MIELPVAMKPKEDEDVGVFFRPEKSGEYLLEGFVVGKDGKKAKLAGTPVKLNLSFPEHGAGNYSHNYKKGDQRGRGLYFCGFFSTVNS